MFWYTRLVGESGATATEAVRGKMLGIEANGRDETLEGGAEDGEGEGTKTRCGRQAEKWRCQGGWN